MNIDFTNASIAYRGEGNSSLVIAFQTCSEYGVIRIPKKEKNETLNESESGHNLKTNTSFIKNVLMQLINGAFIECPKIIHLSKQQIEELRTKVEHCRSDYRLHKSLPEENCFALLMSDFCGLSKSSVDVHKLIGPLISVEIKPKQGFKEITCADSCVYSSMQKEKLKNCSIKRISNYCPLDLFSGCRFRMKKALKSLIENPQNNFRIFKDFELCFSDNNVIDISKLLSSFINGVDLDVEDVFCDLLIDALLKSALRNGFIDVFQLWNRKFSQESCKEHNSLICDKQFCKEKCILPNNCVLGNILRIQLFDTIDSNLASKLLAFYRKRVTGENDFSKLNIPPGIGHYHPLPDENENDFMIRKLWEFLVSLTTKDCSVMIAMQQIEGSSTNGTGRILKCSHTNTLYAIRISLVDLDQKHHSKVEKLANRCQNLL